MHLFFCSFYLHLPVHFCLSFLFVFLFIFCLYVHLLFRIFLSFLPSNSFFSFSNHSVSRIHYSSFVSHLLLFCFFFSLLSPTLTYFFLSIFSPSAIQMDFILSAHSCRSTSTQNIFSWILRKLELSHSGLSISGGQKK